MVLDSVRACLLNRQSLSTLARLGCVTDAKSCYELISGAVTQNKSSGRLLHNPQIDVPASGMMTSGADQRVRDQEESGSPWALLAGISRLSPFCAEQESPNTVHRTENSAIKRLHECQTAED